MCHSEPNIYGTILSVADDLGHDLAPQCCGTEMTGKNLDDGYQRYTCGDCQTVLDVDDLGLVDDIREAA